MLIIPAIDILGGKVVRLKQGVMEDAKKYYEDPFDVARMFEDLGAKRVHIVDLDGAKKGDTVNFPVIEKVAVKTEMKVEVGGGIRNFDKVRKYLDIGVDYLIIGTAAVKDRDFTVSAVIENPGKIILGFDCKGEYIATDGWYEKSEVTIFELIDFYKGYPVSEILYTDISRDGMLTGYNFEMLEKVAKYSNRPVIASGGLKGIEDIKRASQIENIGGCIVGKAFYEGKIDLKEAFLFQRG